MERPLLVYTTFPDLASAMNIGEALVRERLIACINVFPGMQSVYSWKGAVERGAE
ncbi:divalent-cation tolerance protein CutA, partial [Escherichia coli]|nr:divalent-cation tolerance protein CutA [Escherichia coli]